jgi:hypothetical protein
MAVVVATITVRVVPLSCTVGAAVARFWPEMYRRFMAVSISEETMSS